MTRVERTVHQATQAGASVLVGTPDTDKAIQRVNLELGALALRARVTVRRPPIAGELASCTVSVDGIEATYSARTRV